MRPESRPIPRPAKRNGKPPAPPRINIAGIRREQIVEAAAEIIATQGIQNLSLSEIEAHTGMSRGQLTYYYKTKEDILLAVFDRTVQRMREQFESSECSPYREFAWADVWDKMQGLLALVLGKVDFRSLAQAQPNFPTLQYTFLAQAGHRDDFRQRLASLFEGWRGHMTEELQEQSPPPAADARLLASLFQALIHGLAMQLQADPNAFDRDRMYELCVAVLGGVLGRRPAAPRGRST